MEVGHTCEEGLHAMSQVMNSPPNGGGGIAREFAHREGDWTIACGSQMLYRS